MIFKIRRWIKKKLLKRSKLKHWLILEELKNRIVEDQGNAAKLMCEYLSSAICIGAWDEMPWLDVAKDFVLVASLNTPKGQYPIFNQPKEQDISRVRYNNWLWFMWANVMMTQYGWDLEYVSNLDIDDAISLIQEIQISTQDEREWEWVLSEKSVGYDERTKKSKFVPYDKPKWMQKPKEQIVPRKIKIDPKMLPSGLILRWSDDNVKH